MWQQERRAKFQVGNAFYRATSQTARDLGVLAAALTKLDTDQLRVLDAMTGCGVRALRYIHEANADWVWANDANPDIGLVLHQNLTSQLEAKSFRITHWSANRVFYECHQRQDFYDLIDIDHFGNPSAQLSACLLATRIGGLIYLTSTDGRTISGHDPEASLQHYGVYARSHPACHEQGLRILIGALLQQATMQDLSIEPVFSLFQGQLYRVMVRLRNKQPWVAGKNGFLGYCHHCGHYQTVGWRQLSRATCSEHPQPRPLTLSGPLWLGPLHDAEFLQRMATLAQAWDWPQRIALLQLMQAEATMPPYCFTLAEIGRRGKMDIPQRDRLIQSLTQKGYLASPTHINPQAIKTTAPLKVCTTVAQHC